MEPLLMLIPKLENIMQLLEPRAILSVNHTTKQNDPKGDYLVLQYRRLNASAKNLKFHDFQVVVRAHTKLKSPSYTLTYYAEIGGTEQVHYFTSVYALQSHISEFLLATPPKSTSACFFLTDDVC